MPAPVRTHTFRQIRVCRTHDPEVNAFIGSHSEQRWAKYVPAPNYAEYLHPQPSDHWMVNDSARRWAVTALAVSVGAGCRGAVSASAIAWSALFGGSVIGYVADEDLYFPASALRLSLS